VVQKHSATIAACATSNAPAGVAIIRISGPDTKGALRALFKSRIDPIKHPRTVVVGEVLDSTTKETLDRSIVFFMPSPGSFTGEDVAEIQCHGSPLLVRKILRSLYSYGVAPAHPGEFTKRAFLNGKLDLVQAEAIGDLISASTEQALKLAAEQLNGRLSGTISSIGTPLRDALAELEASIDFPEEDINPASERRIVAEIEKTGKEIEKIINSYAYGQVVKEGFRVLLAGPPNAGKSSLLNLFVGHQRAIVTPISGTTRDLLEEEVTLDGLRFVFCDSAGLRETTDTVEQVGIELAKSRVPWADLVLFIIDGGDTDAAWQLAASHLRGLARRVWLVVNKVDIAPDAFSTVTIEPTLFSQRFFLSAKTESGFSALQDALVEEVRNAAIAAEGGSTTITNERHRLALISAHDAIHRAGEAHRAGQPTEIVSLELRHALTSLDEIVGVTSTEDILGRIFSKFCIGK
jgi:tRNA modification GTPase